MPTDNAPPATQLYAIEVHEAGSNDLNFFYVIAHPVRAPSPQTAIWAVLQAYPFHIRHWRLQAVPASRHF